MKFIPLSCSLLGMMTLGPQALAASEVAQALLVRHAELREQLASNPFGRPLYLQSSEEGGQLKGEIYAQLEQPFAVAAPALQSMAQWCQVLILHLNVKGCRPSSAGSVATLQVDIGRKYEQPLANAYPFAFTYRANARGSDALQVRLSAADGPLGTRDYQIAVELVALDAQHSFLHLSYAYRYGMAAHAAMGGYLATLGRDKVGFSVVGTDSAGQPQYQGSMRGVVERNTMRYFLAVEAYLGALSVSAAEQQERRLNDWHTGVERYPRQLHELERDEYLAMKRKEIRRQQNAQPAPVAE